MERVTVGARLGLVPRRHPSGEIDRSGRISKQGDALLRGYLYEAATVLISRLQRPCPLRAWACSLAERIGVKKARVGSHDNPRFKMRPNEFSAIRDSGPAWPATEVSIWLELREPAISDVLASNDKAADVASRCRHYREFILRT
jgi:hypothetical protein